MHLQQGCAKPSRNVASTAVKFYELKCSFSFNDTSRVVFGILTSRARKGISFTLSFGKNLMEQLPFRHIRAARSILIHQFI